MKIKSKVVMKYLELCPTSSRKCDSFEEIKYKIERAVTLGKVVSKAGIDKRVIRYYHLNFIVKNNIVIDMIKDEESKKIEISEHLKRRYDNTYDKTIGKVIV
jgi:hypothetical protein